MPHELDPELEFGVRFARARGAFEARMMQTISAKNSLTIRRSTGDIVLTADGTNLERYNKAIRAFANICCSEESERLLTFLLYHKFSYERAPELFREKFEKKFIDQEHGIKKFQTLMMFFPKIDQKSLSIMLEIKDTTLTHRLRALEAAALVLRTDPPRPYPKYSTITDEGVEFMRNSFRDAHATMAPSYNRTATDVPNDGDRRSVPTPNLDLP